jgi:glucokinase
MKMKFYAGIDLGGTKIYSVIIDEKGKILGSEKTKTNREDDQENIISRILESYLKALSKAGLTASDIECVGMAVPGAVNVDEGILINAPNLGWKNIELTKKLSVIFRKPFFIDNDANLGIYGEYSFNKPENVTNIYGLFIGTGIGGGYISDGEIIRGTNFTAGEIGHSIIKIGGPLCNCGKRGCFEAMAGKLGITNYMKKEVDRKKMKTMLNEICPDWRKSVGSKDLHKCFIKNDRLVVKAITRSAKVTGIVCANLINQIGVDAILLGGGLIEELGDILIPIINEYMVDYAFGDGARGIKLFKSRLGDDAIALGAAWYASRPENKKYLIG